ncbi:MAG: OxaA precursor, partial [Lysinibacillus fusiformis]|nr:OxaA precursor [Lysinibacillus fusiformis]
MKKRLWIVLTLVATVVLLSGCSEFNQPISAESKGFWNEFIVWPLVSVIQYFADLFGTYGLG